MGESPNFSTQVIVHYYTSVVKARKRHATVLRMLIALTAMGARVPGDTMKTESYFLLELLEVRRGLFPGRVIKFGTSTE